MRWGLVLTMVVQCGLLMAQQNEIEAVKERSDHKKLEVIIAPNPCDGKTTIKVPKGATCMLLSSQGKIIGKWTVQGGELDFENLTAGAYWVVINFENQILRKKLMVL